MKKPHINAANWKSYSDGIAEKRESWVKETSATIVCIMEWKRFILGLSMDDYYGGLLHYKMNPRTCRKMLDGESNVPMELFLSFCFTFGYDIKRFAASSEFLGSDFADSMERADNIATDEADLNCAVDNVNKEAASEIERLTRVQDREEVSTDVI